MSTTSTTGVFRHEIIANTRWFERTFWLVGRLVVVLIVLQGMGATDGLGLGDDALIVVGAGGTDEYREQFVQNALQWKKSFEKRGDKPVLIGETNESNKSIVTDRERILGWIANQRPQDGSRRWLILIGHGTYQKKVANFNLLGPDLAASDLAEAVRQIKGSWRIVVCTSSSSPFIQALSGPDRIVVTATKSGSEQNYSLFGNYLAKSISNIEADLDHDGGVTLLEAFLDASGRLARWYESENRLAAEQALLDDNGDARGTPAVFLRGVRAVKAAADGAALDGSAAHRCYLIEPKRPNDWSREKEAEVRELETKIEELRQIKTTLDETSYYLKLEKLLVEVATLLGVE